MFAMQDGSFTPINEVHGRVSSSSLGEWGASSCLPSGGAAASVQVSRAWCSDTSESLSWEVWPSWPRATAPFLGGSTVKKASRQLPFSKYARMISKTTKQQDFNLLRWPLFQVSVFTVELLFKKGCECD